METPGPNASQNIKKLHNSSHPIQLITAKFTTIVKCSSFSVIVFDSKFHFYDFDVLWFFSLENSIKILFEAFILKQMLFPKKLLFLKSFFQTEGKKNHAIIQAI
jgi:hypothetical protein